MDLISRQAVKDLIYSGICTDTDADKEYACELVDRLPSISQALVNDSQGLVKDWISVSERLPEECIHTYDNNFHNYLRSESVLVTVFNKVTGFTYVFNDFGIN